MSDVSAKILSYSSILPREVSQFTDIAEAWWDMEGDFAPLHRLNPSRLSYIRDRLTRHFDRDDSLLSPFEGLRLCDVGCGGGLISEPMRRLGFDVTAIDAGAANIDVATRHAAGQNLAIDYRCTTAEGLAETGERFDAVLAMELIEHVADPEALVVSLARLLKPGGAVVVSTLNRTLKSLALAKLGAEYILRWVPAGTHDWRKFLKPSELTRFARSAGLNVVDLAGVSLDPKRGDWRIGRDLDINYMFLATAA